jgi:CHASE2 domain-containing sensor protein
MKNKSHTRFLNRDALLITAFTFLFYWLFHLFFVNIHILDGGNFNAEDSDINDILYTRFGREKTLGQINQDIFLVNIGKANRDEIARMIDHIASQKPKVMGLDVSFSNPEAENSDTLKAMLKKHQTLIVSSGFFRYKDQGDFASFVKSDTNYISNSQSVGHTNFLTSYSQSKIRQFMPFVSFQNQTIPAFAVAVVEKASPERYQDLKKRKDSTDIINYKYAQDDFITLENKDVLSRDLGSKLSIKDKIVLFGYIGDSTTVHTSEDYHFTPLNQDPAEPDMSGVAIHANIINMILTKDYIHHFSEGLTYLLSFIICFFHIKWFIILSHKYHLWFHFQFKLIQLISLIIIVFLCLLIYNYGNYRIETSIIAVPIALSADVLAFGRSIAKWIHQKHKIPSYFVSRVHH